MPFDFAFEIPNIDFNFIFQWGQLPMPLLFWQIIKSGGWILVYFVVLVGVRDWWLTYVQAKAAKDKKYILLAVDVPRDSEQSPKAAENFFSHLGGVYNSSDFWEKYWDGDTQEMISLEIVSIDGYVQFIVQCLDKLRDLVESALYAQYPDVEITEVADYVDGVPQRYPAEGYKFFGTEFELNKHYAYPIKTYEEFEHSLTQDLKDPISAVLENLAHLQVGEQLWLQLLVAPTTDDWKNTARREIGKLIKEPYEASVSLGQKIVLAPIFLVVKIVDAVLFAIGIDFSAEVEKKERMKVSEMTPGEKDVIQAMEKKISKVGFECKYRLMYIAREESFSKVRGVASVLGALKQYNTLNLNAFRPNVATVAKIKYFFVKSRLRRRQNLLMSGYSQRSMGIGGEPFILNIEELASLYHFPDLTIKTPSLKRTSSKRAEAPVGLPVDFSGDDFLPGIEIIEGPAKREVSVPKSEQITQDFEFDNEQSGIFDYFDQEYPVETQYMDESLSLDEDGKVKDDNIQKPAAFELADQHLNSAKTTVDNSKKGSPPIDLPIG